MPAIAYRCTAKTMTRSRGQNAVAAVAYRTGMKLEDERNKKTQDYTRKQGVEFVYHAPPKNAPPWAHDIEQTWNAVEQKEVRSNSVVAREYIVSFPHELKAEQRELILKAFVSEEFTRKNLISTSAIHAPSSEGDERNYHAHILFHDRPLFADGFASHKDRSVKQKEFLLHIRDRWAELGSEQLRQSGFELVSDRWKDGHKSLSVQRELAVVRGDIKYAEELEGRQGTIHLGTIATILERKGIPSRLGNVNREIEAGNKKRLDLAKARRKADSKLIAKQQQEAKIIAELELVKKELEEKRELEAFKATSIAQSAESLSIQTETLQKQTPTDLAPQEQSDLAQQVYLKANEFFEKMKKAKLVSRSKETGEVKFVGAKRTIVLSQKGSQFSIKDTQSGEELLRVRLEGENSFVEKSQVTFDDLLLFAQALNKLKSQTKSKGKDLAL